MMLWFCIPSMSHYFQRLVKLIIYYQIPLRFRKYKILDFQFRFYYFPCLNKKDINITHLGLHILVLTIEFVYSDRQQHMIILIIPEIMRKSLIKTVVINKFLQQRSSCYHKTHNSTTHHKNSVRINKNHSVITKKLNLILQKKSQHRFP